MKDFVSLTFACILILCSFSSLHIRRDASSFGKYAGYALNFISVRRKISHVDDRHQVWLVNVFFFNLYCFVDDRY